MPTYLLSSSEKWFHYAVIKYNAPKPRRMQLRKTVQFYCLRRVARCWIPTWALRVCNLNFNYRPAVRKPRMDPSERIFAYSGVFGFIFPCSTNETFIFPVWLAVICEVETPSYNYFATPCFLLALGKCEMSNNMAEKGWNRSGKASCVICVLFFERVWRQVCVFIGQTTIIR